MNQQVVEHYLIIDFEATCSNNFSLPKEEMEIIEIGAVMACAESLEVLDEFQSFVRPVRNPELTRFCTELTHISQEDVDRAPGFAETLAALTDWADPFSHFLFSSWGDYDKTQLKRDCTYHNLPYPFERGHLNLKQTFASYGRRRMGIGDALQTVGLAFSGTLHRGIDDARNIARLLPYTVSPIEKKKKSRTKN